MKFFNLPVDISHAQKIVDRLEHVLERAPRPQSDGGRQRLREMRWIFGEPDELEQLIAQARLLVQDIEQGGYGHDRLGQCVRNLFECLGRGQEGAELSLLVGEDPNSLQRP